MRHQKHDSRRLQFDLFKYFADAQEVTPSVLKNILPIEFSCATMPPISNLESFDSAFDMMNSTTLHTTTPEAFENLDSSHISTSIEEHSKADHAIQNDRSRTASTTAGPPRTARVQQLFAFDDEPARGATSGESFGDVRNAATTTTGLERPPAKERSDGDSSRPAPDFVLQNNTSGRRGTDISGRSNGISSPSYSSRVKTRAKGQSLLDGVDELVHTSSFSNKSMVADENLKPSAIRSQSTTDWRESFDP